MTPVTRLPHRLAALAVIVVAIASTSLPSPAIAGDRIVIGISPGLSGALTVVAKQEGFFARHGVDADVRVVESGSKAVAMMLNDEIDVAESTGFALVTNSFQRNDFRIVAQISTTGNNNMIIARKDRGIAKVADLAGKKVGVLKGGFPQYILDLMLLDAGLNPKKITLVYEEMDRLHALIASGGIDAGVFYGRWVDETKKALGGNAVIFHDPKIANVTIVHSIKSRRLEQNPDLYTNVLKAYIDAEDYMKRNSDSALKTVVDHLKLDAASAKTAWKPNFSRVSLDKSLVYDLENLAKWQINIGMQKDAKVPNYLDFIHFKTLSGIAPARVTIAH